MRAGAMSSAGIGLWPTAIGIFKIGGATVPRGRGIGDTRNTRTNRTEKYVEGYDAAIQDR